MLFSQFKMFVTRKCYNQNSIFDNKFTKIKHKTVKKLQHDIVYYYVKSSEDYTGEAARRLSERETERERVLEHNGRNAKSHLIKHAFEKCHKYPKIEDFNVISK